MPVGTRSRGAKGQSNRLCLGSSFFLDAGLENRKGKAVKSDAHGNSAGGLFLTLLNTMFYEESCEVGKTEDNVREEILERTLFEDLQAHSAV